MELILISDSKLKIMLTRDDMQQYALNCDTIDYDNTETRRAFWSILDEAKHRTGFDAAAERVFVQLYPSKEGGCEMYVTKLGFDEGRAQRALLPGGASKRGVLRSRICAYRFACLDDLVTVCRRLRLLPASPPSSVWRDDEGGWHLILDETDAAPAPLSFLCEFGDAEDAGRLSMYIAEHGICVRQGDAAKVLGAL
ncbi:MAG: adaptor protein MecA [Clostridia bacterium]|nr:adaptor protein MecA [Clostridia bacterium]